MFRNHPPTPVSSWTPTDLSSDSNVSLIHITVRRVPLAEELDIQIWGQSQVTRLLRCARAKVLNMWVVTPLGGGVK